MTPDATRAPGLSMPPDFRSNEIDDRLYVLSDAIDQIDKLDLLRDLDVDQFTGYFQLIKKLETPPVWGEHLTPTLKGLKAVRAQGVAWTPSESHTPRPL